MARVGEEFPLECPNCGGDIRLIAFITEPGPIRKILTHLGEPLEPPPVSPARGPPTDWGELVQIHDDRDVFQASDRRTDRDRHPQPLTGVGHEASKPPERPTGTRSAPTRDKRHRMGMRGVLANRLRMAETPNFAAQGQSVSRKTVAEVPSTGLSFRIIRQAESTSGLTAGGWSQIGHEPDSPHRSALWHRATAGPSALAARPINPARFEDF
jgi:hypothetical protein